MIDFTPTLSRAYSARLDTEAADARETAQRAQEIRKEMLGVLLSGIGAVRYLDSTGRGTTMTAPEALECYAEPADVLDILREIERTPSVPASLRIRVGGLFAQIANEFGEIAAENAR